MTRFAIATAVVVFGGGYRRLYEIDLSIFGYGRIGCRRVPTPDYIPVALYEKI